MFLAAWLTHPDFKPLVKRIWERDPNILNCITTFTEEVKIWNSETFGAIGKRKRRLLSRIRGIQSKLEDHHNSSTDLLADLESSLRDEFENVCFQEELLWLQKSSSEWICLGDRNTHYYHMKTLLRRRKNRITQLKNSDGLWMTDDGILAAHAREFFKSLYSLDETFCTPLSLCGA
ncbi:hypothetical protein K1719_027165 [Acacia pycnantha]|nr:hypothetical protein K1719_027165 [Acacia pycnantha]